MALIGGSFLRVSAQEPIPKIDKAKFYYVDEKYEKCIHACQKMAESDKWKKDPLVYAYAAMSYFEIAKNPDKYDEFYSKKAFISSMKWAYKFVKKDSKKKEHKKNFNDFLVALKDSAHKLGQTFYLTDNYRKSNYVYKKIIKVDPQDATLWLWKGVTEHKNKATGEAVRSFDKAMLQIKPGYKPDETSKSYLAFGLKEYADIMSAQGEYSKSSSAKKLFEDYKKYDPAVIDAKKMAEKKALAKKQEKEIKVFTSDENDQ